MVDAYEQIHGPVDDRSIFDGEIIVPPHLRNMSLTNLRPNRLHSGLLGSLSRSRTFLTMPTNSRHTFHGSVPNLSHIFTDRLADKSHTIDTRNGNNSINYRNSSSKVLLNHNTCEMTSLDVSLRRGVFDGDDTGNGHGKTIVNNNNSSKNSLNEVELPDSIESLNPSQTDSYMTLIHTNVHNRSSRGPLNRSINRSPLCAITSSQNGINLPESSSLLPLPMSRPPTNTTDTFHPAPKFQTQEPSLKNLSKFTLPRVSLSNLSNLPNTSTPSSASVTPSASLKRFKF